MAKDGKRTDDVLTTMRRPHEGDALNLVAYMRYLERRADEIRAERDALKARWEKIQATESEARCAERARRISVN